MRRSFLAVAGVALLAAACPPRQDVTPVIHVDPRAARRADLLAHAPTPELAPSGAAAAAAPARVHVMRAGDALRGPNAVGRPGDLMLENDQVVFVIDRLGPGWGFAESGGNVVDAADARDRADELGQVFTYFGTFPRQALYDALDSGTSPDGSAWVEARGRELLEPALAVTTRYTLRAPDRALLVETRLVNGSAAPVRLAGVGDAVQWGGTEKVAPGKARNFKGPSSGPYVGGVGRLVSYAITSTDGAIDAISGAGWTDTTQQHDVTLAPGAGVAYARVLVVGERPDTASLVAELAQTSGQAVGGVAIALRPAPGEPAVEVPPDARVSVQDARGAEVLVIHAAGTPPALQAMLPPGRWGLAYAGGGGRAGQGSATVEVTPGGEARAELTVTRAAGARIACVASAGGPSPCKVTFERTDGGPAPDFGPAFAAGPARDQVTAADGVADVALAPGAYRVTASRGPEYALAAMDLTLAPGDHADTRLPIARVVDTTGYLGCDFHQHSSLSADAQVATRDRVIANAAEGVEIAVASEHNFIADLEPIVKELHLDEELVAIAGDEVTSDASRAPWGHANVYPLPFDAEAPRGGAPPVRDRTARDVLEAMRQAAAPGEVVVQINHPRSGSNGYFDRLAFDAKTGAGTGPGYDAAFDALEVWNGRNVQARGRVLDDFFAMLRASRPVTPTADTDTHGIVGQEAGYPRTYVRVQDDAHLGAWDGARTADLVRAVKATRDVVLTNGPMLRVTGNGVPVGGLAKGPVVRVKVHVESAPWVRVDELRLVRASAPDRADVQRVTPRPNARGALAADATFTVRVQQDDAVVVVAQGAAPMTPVLREAGGDPAALLPWAMTGAIWIDADGDGKAQGR